MTKIETFVIIDLETIGLPHKEYNRTKITEICLLATSREDIQKTEIGKLPHPISKLSFLLKPQKPIIPDSPKISRIANNRDKKTLVFKEKINTINAFLEDLKKPVCLVAHNGIVFDYKILLAECADGKVSLPHDLLCVDSLNIFRKIDKVTVSEKTIPSASKRASMNLSRSMNSNKSRNSRFLSDTTSDDEGECPGLNVTPEKCDDIDKLCSSFSCVSPTSKISQKLNKSEASLSDKKKRLSMKLSVIFKRYFGGMKGLTAHRAEDDCLMLLHCMVASQADFIKLSDSNCTLLSDCKPFERKLPTVDNSEREVPTAGNSERKVLTVGNSERKVLGNSERKVLTVGNSNRKVPTVGNSERKVLTVGNSERKVLTVGNSERKVPTVVNSNWRFLAYAEWIPFFAFFLVLYLLCVLCIKLNM